MQVVKSAGGQQSFFAQAIPFDAQTCIEMLEIGRAVEMLIGSCGKESAVAQVTLVDAQKCSLMLGRGTAASDEEIDAMQITNAGNQPLLMAGPDVNINGDRIIIRVQSSPDNCTAALPDLMWTGVYCLPLPFLQDVA